MVARRSWIDRTRRCVGKEKEARARTRLNSRSGCAGQRQVRVGLVRVMTTMVVVVVVGNTVVGSRSAGAFAAAEVAAARSTSH